MRRWFLVFLFCSYCLAAQETELQPRRGQAAFYASRDATAMSIMGWGLVIIVGIGTLFALLDNNATSSAH